MLITLAVLAAASVVSNTAAAEAGGGAEYNPFARGHVSTSLNVGILSTRNATYLRLGAGVGYFLADGLKLGFDADFLVFDSPVVLNLTPGLTYVFYSVPILKPYVGGFYRHAIVINRADLDSIGGRAGVYFAPGRIYLGAGLVYEHWLNCNSSSFTSCDDLYPEVLFAISF
jgi:hypothetical protein